MGGFKKAFLETKSTLNYKVKEFVRDLQGIGGFFWWRLAGSVEEVLAGRVTAGTLEGLRVWG